MDRILFMLTLKPIVFGLVGMLVSGIAFPVAGVIIIKNGLIPMRYMLMHGVILGGMLAISLNVPLLWVVIPVNVMLVMIMMAMNRSGHALSSASTAMMVCTMGIASLLSHIFDIPAKDTLEVLWGSPFALTAMDLAVLGALALLILIYVTVFFRPISMVFFDPDIASSLGVDVKLHSTVMVLFTALIISVAMKVIGALLIDALVVLPVVGVARNASSLKELFAKSAALGFVLSLAGYMLALLWNLPVSGVLAVLATLAFAFNSLIRRKSI